MKKVLLVFLLAIVLVCVSACKEEPPVLREGTSPNEVLTLKEIPTGKVAITIRVEDGMDALLMEEAIEKQFSDVDILVVPNTPMGLASANNDIQDLFCSAYASTAKLNHLNGLMDLSDKEFVGNYHLNALKNCELNGKLYCLPGPSNIYGIVYDKELFDDNGWNIPTSLDEFIELCETIEATGIRALQPALQYSDATRQLFDGFNYQPLFDGVDNYQWLQSYKNGDVEMTSHVSSGFTVLERFIEAGILKADDFIVGPRDRSIMMYRDHTCAMILETQMAPTYAEKYGEGKQHELGIMPFFSGSIDGDYLLSVPNYYIGANNSLKNPGSEKKLEKVMEILSWISSVEGQRAIISPDTPMISSVKGVSLNNNEFLENVEKTIAEGRVVPQPFWYGEAGSNVDSTFRSGIISWINGEKTVEEVMSDCDKERDKLVSNQVEPAMKSIGKATKTFTVLETSLYFAELFKEEMDADIGIVLSNSHTCGNNGKIYEGDICINSDGTVSKEYLYGYLLENFKTSSMKNANTQLLKVTMTGSQIISALNDPVSQSFYPNRYYVAAGLKIEFAPWAGDGNRYVSVKLADGTDLDPSKLYTVAVWNASVNENYIEETISVSELTAYEIFVNDVTSKGEISPISDGRFTLNWDIIESEKE